MQCLPLTAYRKSRSHPKRAECSLSVLRRSGSPSAGSPLGIFLSGQNFPFQTAYQHRNRIPTDHSPLAFCGAKNDRCSFRTRGSFRYRKRRIFPLMKEDRRAGYGEFQSLGNIGKRLLKASRFFTFRVRRRHMNYSRRFRAFGAPSDDPCNQNRCYSQGFPCFFHSSLPKKLLPSRKPAAIFLQVVYSANIGVER